MLLTVPLALALTVGCNKSSQSPAANNAPAPTSDQQVAVDVQAKILGDSVVQNKQMTINAKDGVVTLSGQVASDAERAAAASDAAAVSGVKTVVNNLSVSNAATQQPPAVNTPEVPPAVAEKARRSSPSHMARNTPPAPIHNGNGKNDTKNYSDTSNTASNAPTSNDAGNNVASAQPATPPAPAPPQKVTVAAGTTLSIRLSQPLASDKNQDGDTFKGSLQSSVTDENGNVAIPQGADVTGRVVSVKAAGKFAGQPQLALTLYQLS
ncbi:MAG TPA: BON domain-containing protein, partial [Terriglobales bacterium]